MENKEAILMPFNKVVTGQRDWATTEALKQYTDMQRQASYREGIFKGYSKALYDLSSQNEELQKAFENNKEQLMELATHARDLESTIDEKNKELDILRQNILDGLKNESWQFKEIERLKGLIEDAHNSGWRRGYSLHTEIDESLKQFKTDNNL